MDRTGRRSAGRLGSALTLLVFLLVVAAVAAVEGLASTATTSGWFRSSAQVFWTAPRPISRPAWVVLFVLLAVVGWLVWRARDRGPLPAARATYAIALFLLLVWPPMYLDGYPLIGTAALWIAFTMAFALLIALSAVAIMTWGPRRIAAILLIPAIVWILYVTTINFGDAVLESLR